MNKKKRIVATLNINAQKAARAERARLDAEHRQKREQAIEQILNKGTRIKPPQSIVSPIAKAIIDKASKLYHDERYKNGIEVICSSKHVRDIDEWVPKGKSCETLYRSLASHVFAKFPMPAFLWSAFFVCDKREIETVKRIAAGESLFKMAQVGEFPLPLTRKQCHDFLASPSDFNFIQALRRMQVKTHGGNLRLYQTWIGLDFGRNISTQDREIFWDGVLAWFSKHSMLDVSQISPLVDYITFRKREDATFTMKGRSPIAMIRGMEQWHKDLGKSRDNDKREFGMSGFRDGSYSFPNDKLSRTWYVNELLSGKALNKEGSELKHCAASYARSVEEGRISMWSMTEGHQKVITIEVHNQTKQIMQARGRFNRSCSNEEFRILTKWAQDNNLIISRYLQTNM